jgi:hypothetical protein
MAIKLPSQTPGGASVEANSPTRLVIIGANGSGKTRFGIWLEQQNQNNMIVHRLSAQKALNLPERAPMKSLEQAEKDLLYGRHDQHAGNARKVQDRWGGNPATFLLTDYEALLAVLFAKDAERDRLHTKETRRTGIYVPVPDSAIDRIGSVWDSLMPHRTISFHDGKVLVSNGSPSEYHAKEMSDGERVALYLLGQCLSAPSGSMLIIDEPELHLHRSLIDKLWNKVEQLCPDKSLVYITHDLDFAATRIGARKIWVQSFTGSAWTWADVPSDDALPEPLVLELIGSRKPILFCEGEKGGLDHTIYQLCLSHMHVVPRGGSDQVVQATKALRTNSALHTLTAHGIVDRDARMQADIVALETHGIQVLAFAEIENLLCSEVIVKAIASQLKRDPTATINQVRNYVITALRGEFDTQVALRATHRIRHHLSHFTPPNSEPDCLDMAVGEHVASLDTAAIIAEERASLHAALDTGDLECILGVYNRKSIADRISSVFGLKPGEYTEIVLRILKSADGHALLDAIKSKLPQLLAEQGLEAADSANT